LLAKQRKIGVVHARIGLPIDLVNRGARKLKDELYRVLKTKADDSSSLLSNAICFSSLAMDTALEAMTVSYSQATKTPCIRRAVSSADYLR
jgi:diguanylate cyclase